MSICVFSVWCVLCDVTEVCALYCILLSQPPQSVSVLGFRPLGIVKNDLFVLTTLTSSYCRLFIQLQSEAPSNICAKCFKCLCVLMCVYRQFDVISDAAYIPQWCYNDCYIHSNDAVHIERFIGDANKSLYNSGDLWSDWQTAIHLFLWIYRESGWLSMSFPDIHHSIGSSSMVDSKLSLSTWSQRCVSGTWHDVVEWRWIILELFILFLNWNNSFNFFSNS